MTFRISALVVLLCMSMSARPAEFEYAAGIGFQYGGILGWQGAIRSDRHRGYLGVGLIGLSLGYDYSISENVAIGLQTFNIVSAQGGGIYANYHFRSTATPGWVVGIDVFNVRSTLLTDESSFDARVFVSVGYKM